MPGSRSASAPTIPGDRVAGLGGLRPAGFAHARPEELGFAPDRHQQDFQQISEAFRDLPRDPYAENSNRFRRYSRIVFLPWNDELFWVPGTRDEQYGSVTGYDQNGFNPEFPQGRRFPDVPAAIRDNRLLERIVRADIANALWLDDFAHSPVYAGVHMVKLAVTEPDAVAFSSPNCLHQDGGDRMFTFVHLVACHNVVGGENVIAAPHCAGRRPEELAPGEVLARFTLTEPLETYAVHDHRVSHHVSPVTLGDTPGTGERAVLIIGVAPYVPRF